jgi:hypothetical protein
VCEFAGSGAVACSVVMRCGTSDLTRGHKHHRACAFTALLHETRSGPWYFVLVGSSSSWPRSHGSSGSISSPHLAHDTPPALTIGRQASRSRRCSAP